MSDRKSDEQIVARALLDVRSVDMTHIVILSGDEAGDVADATELAKRAISALRAAGRLAGEPSEDAVERARGAYLEHMPHTQRYFERTCESCGGVFDGLDAYQSHRMRAALSAAGVTPHPVDEATIERLIMGRTATAGARAVVAHLNKTGETT